MTSEEIKGDAVYLRSRGYTSKDVDRLAEEYGMFGIPRDYAIAVCLEIGRLEIAQKKGGSE